MQKKEETQDKKEYCLMKISQKAIIYDPAQDKFLLAKVADKESNFYKKYGPWEFFGGRLEKDESPVDSLMREISEEAGDIKVTIKNLVASHLITGPFGETMFLGYLTIFHSGEVELSHEHDEYAWKSAEEVRVNPGYRQWLKEFVLSANEYLSKKELKKEIVPEHIKAGKHENKEEEYLSGWKRCMADFENYKKRQQESQKSLGEYLKIDSMLQILPVIDNFRSATEHIPAEQKEAPWVVGIMYIQKQLEDILKENSVTEMDVKVGDEFDPTLHEAMVDNEANSRKEKELTNKIKKVVVSGYMLGEKVIRAARVIVE